MRIVITGGRLRVPRAAVEAVLDKLAQTWGGKLTVIHGNAKGVDSFADFWARDRGHIAVPVSINPKYDGHSDTAPKMRNWRMLDEAPDACVAFPGGPGTRHMVEIAHQKRLPLYDVELDDGEFRVFQWGLLTPGPKKKATLVCVGTYQQ